MTGRPMPLSAGQRAVWLGHQLVPDSAAFNTVVATRIRSRLDVRALARAVEAVGERHELLRSAFVEVDGRPGRILSERARPRLDRHDVAGLTGTGLRDRARAVGAAPVRLSEDGPLRVTLLEHGPQDAVLVVVAHHLVADASSLWLILRDLLTAYQGLAEGGSPRWTPLRTTFDAHVRAEQDLLASATGARLATWWQQHIAGRPATELPTDRPRRPVRSGRGGTAELRLPAELTADLRSRAARLRVTPFGYLLGGLQALLHRHTGQAEFSIGCPATLRSRPDLRDVVGYLVNPLVVPARFTPATTLGETVTAAQRHLVEGMARARYPCALLPGPAFRVVMTQVDTDRLEPPLPMVEAGATEGPGIDYAGLRLHLYDLPQQEGQADLSISVLPHRGSLRLVVNYDADLFDHATVERLIRQLQRVLEAAPETRVPRIRLQEQPDVRALLAMGTGRSVG